MNENVREQLKQIIAQYGIEVCADRRRLEGLLLDFCGEHRREVNVLVAAVREGVVGELLQVSDSRIDEWQYHRYVKQLYEDAGIAEGFARWAVESWVAALGKELPDGVKETSTPQQPVAGKPPGTPKETLPSQQVAGNDPQDAADWVNRGVSLNELGCHKEAKRCYDRALEIDPRNQLSFWDKVSIGANGLGIILCIIFMLTGVMAPATIPIGIVLSRSLWRNGKFIGFDTFLRCIGIAFLLLLALVAALGFLWALWAFGD